VRSVQQTETDNGRTGGEKDFVNREVLSFG